MEFEVICQTVMHNGKWMTPCGFTVVFLIVKIGKQVDVLFDTCQSQKHSCTEYVVWCFECSAVSLFMIFSPCQTLEIKTTWCNLFQRYLHLRNNTILISGGKELKVQQNFCNILSWFIPESQMWPLKQGLDGILSSPAHTLTKLEIFTFKIFYRLN